LKEVAREDLTLFLLQEIAKVLKKENITYLLPNIVSLMA
jgi:hypothetical protein